MHPLGPGPRNAWQVDEAQCDLRRARRPSSPGWYVAAQPQNLVVDPERVGLIVIDMQNDFCHPAGWLASIGADVTAARVPIEPLRRLLSAWRTTSAPVVWCNWGNRADRANLPPGVLHVYNPDGRGTGLGQQLAGAGPVLEAGSWGAAVVDELRPCPEDVVVDKYRMSGFWDTPLDSILRNRAVTTVLFAGVNLDQCVLHTMADANFLGYDTLLVEDCAATTNPGFCRDATLLNVRQIFGFHFLSTDLIEAITP